MKQRATVLVARQDELSRVYEACKQRVTYTRNPVTLLSTENDKFNKWINAIVKLVADQTTQTENNNEKSKATFSIISLENERGLEFIFFLWIHNITGPNNESAGPTAEIVSAPAARRRVYEVRGSAHARKIIASLNNQSESLCENAFQWSTQTKLEDLQWTDRPIDESYRGHFLETFIRYNEILRAHGNYYAARTSRYTTIQSLLTPSFALLNNRKRQVVNNPRLSFNSKKLKESQTYRTILPDEKPSGNLAVSEVESLRKENELLGHALRKAADLHLSMLTEAEATRQEKERLAEERQAFENDRSILVARSEELQRLEQSRACDARKENERVTEERRNLETAKQELLSQRKELEEQKEMFARSNAAQAGSLMDQERLVGQQHERLERDQEELAAQTERLRQQETASASNLHTREQSLERQRQALAEERREFAERKEMFERSNEAKVSDLREQEMLAEQQRQRLERDREELTAQSERLRQQETASASNLRTREESLERQRQGLAQDRQALTEWAKIVETSNEANASDLRDQERLVEQQRQRLERDQRELVEQRERLRQQETASATSRREQQVLLEERQRVLEQFEEELVARRRDFEEYYQTRVGDLREREESVEADRRALERDRRRLSTREDELRTQQNAARSTPPPVDDDVAFSVRSVNDGWKGRVKLPLISESIPWRVKLPWY